MKTKHNSINDKDQSLTRHPLGWGLLAMFLVVALAGCKPEAKVTTDKVAADINPVGSYTLVSVDGQNVPCSTTHEGHTMTIKSGMFTINGDGTCGSRITLSVPSRGDMNVDVKATYTRQGPELTMQWEGAGMTMGNVKGNTFTMTNEGMVFAYRR